MYKDLKEIINQKNSTIFAVIDGRVVDKKNRNILSVGDIVKTGTFKKLSKYFNIKQNNTFKRILMKQIYNSKYKII